MEELIEDYKRKIKNIDNIINDSESKGLNREYYRLKIKRGCYREFIYELKQLKDTNNELDILLTKVNSFAKNDKKESSETISKLPRNNSSIKYFQGRQDISNEVIKLLGNQLKNN